MLKLLVKNDIISKNKKEIEKMAYVTRRRPRVFRILLLIMLLACMSVGTVFAFKKIFQNYPESLMKVSETDKDYGKHKYVRKKTDEAIYVLHYPQTNIDGLNDYIQGVMDDTLATLPTQASEAAVEVKQDYAIHHINDRYVSVKLETFENQDLFKTDVRIFDVDTQKFVSTDIFKTDALRYMTSILRKESGLDIKDVGFKNIIVEANNPNLYLEKDTLYIQIDNTLRVFDYKNNTDTLNETFNEVNATNNALPSVYLDYQYDETNPKMVAFTFDDGPHYLYGKEIMDIFDKYEGRATFFIQGYRVADHADEVIAMFDRNHQVGSHAYNHPNFNSISIEAIQQQLDDTETAVKDATGYDEPLFVRPPYGAYEKDKMKNFDVPFINWDVDTEDWLVSDSERICSIALRDISDGSIVLMHEIYESSYQALDCILSELSKQGYQFVSVKDLLLAKDVDIVNGEVYFEAY